jgi:signal transduction histidine kinase
LGHDLAVPCSGGSPRAAHWDAQLNTAVSGADGQLAGPVGRTAGMRIRLRRASWAPTSLAVGGFAVGSLVLAAFTYLRPSHAASATMYATIEAVLTLFAFAAAWRLRGHFRQTLQRRDLLVLAGVLTFGLVHLFACAAPAAADLSSSSYLTATAMWGELFAAALFAAAAFASREPLSMKVRHPGRAVVAGGLISVAAAALAALLLVREQGQAGVADTLRTVPASIIVVGTAALFACTAVRFAREGREAGERSIGLLAAAAALLAAGLSSQLASSFALDPDSLAEALRVLGFGLVLAAAIQWELQARRLTARAAAIAERQRMARDLHDGLAQDLAFIAAHGERIAADVGIEHPVVIAARRALSVSRSAIAELSGPGGASTHEVLEAIAAELRARFEIMIAVDVRLTYELSPDVREHVGRIVREAIANAARHGGATHVAVSLSDNRGETRLRVRDDGWGIRGANGAPAREGFGLRSMRERVSALGGHMTLRQPGPFGTELDVVLP